MLKISLHFSTPSKASSENVLGRLDIGYARLDARADYKLVMFSSGFGEYPPAQLLSYPRWSGSVWDLVSRAVCTCLHGHEAIPQASDERCSRPAFIDDLSAIIEHWPDGLDVRRATIGTAHIRMTRRKGHYIATFETDVENDTQESTIFAHRHRQLQPWGLLARAYAWTVEERFYLPARPKLYLPIPIQDGAQTLVSLDTVSEPAYTGITKWMHKRDLKTLKSGIVEGPCVSESVFVEFLRSAV